MKLDNKYTQQKWIDDFIGEINKKFSWNLSENEVLEKEVEFKVFVAWMKKHSDFKELQDEIINKFNWKVIFDWTIKDKRYYYNDYESIKNLNKNWINFIRIREQKDFKDLDKIEDNKILTIKKLDVDGYNIESEEKKIDDNFLGDNLWEYWLEEIKNSKKKRKEIKFNVKINWKDEDVKVAFDKYYDNNNKIIETFFEIEAISEEIAKKWFEKILKLDSIKDKKIKITYKWPKLIKKDKRRKKIINDFEWLLEEFDEKEKLSKIDNFIKDFIVSASDLLDDENIYISSHELLKDIETTRNFLYNEKLKNSLKNIIESELNKTLLSDKLFNSFFHRIVSNKNSEKDPRKKFFDKFEREYSGYIKSFLNIVVNSYEKEILKNPKINKGRLIKKIILEKLDIFLKSIFMFDDSLTREELEKVINLPRKKIYDNFNSFKESILIILSEIESVPIIWKNDENEIKNKEDLEKNNNNNSNLINQNDRVLNRLSTSYSRWFASTSHKDVDDLWNQEIIWEKVEKIEKEQFSFLSRQFSHWLNSPNRELCTFDIIKNLLKEDFYHIFLLSKKWLAFTELNSEKFDQKFINTIVNNYEDILFNKENFQVEKKWPELFRCFCNNIEEDSKYISDNIIKNFKEFNKDHNRSIKKSKINNLIDISKVVEKDIDFNFWKDLMNNPRIYTFLTKILNINNEWIFIKNRFFNWNKSELEINFIEYEFNKNYKWVKLNEKYLKEINKAKKLPWFNKNKFNKNYKWEVFTEDYRDKLKEYKNLVKIQLRKIKEYKKNNKLIKNHEDLNIILHLVKNDVNSFQLLVSYFQYILKSKNQGKIEDLNLYSESFAENTLNNLWDNILDDDAFEFITSTSSAYNTSISTDKRIIDLHDRIWNDKSINISESFYFDKNWENYFMKDFTNLYLPRNENTNFDENKDFLKHWISIVRNLVNWDKINKNDKYFKILKDIDFPINDSKSLKKLLEFQKIIYKYILPVVEELNKKSEDNTNKFIKNIYKYIEESVWYREWINYKPVSSKWYYRMVEKSIIKYWWDIEQIADSTRATIFWNNLADLSEKISNLIKWLKKNWWIKSIRFDDKIWNIFKKSLRINWYRDATLAITNDDWTTVEIQFHLKSQYVIKTWNLIINESNWKKLLNIDDKLYKLKDFNIWEKIVSNNIIFTDLEKENIINYCNATGFRIANSFSLLFNINEDSIIDSNIIFNTDFTYNLERTLWKINEWINEKLFKLDKILFDIADWDLATKEIKRIINSYNN